MTFRFPRVYPLTDVSLSGMSHFEQVSKLLDGGATLIQLREKTLTSREFYEDARAALTLARSRGAKIIINDRADLTLSLGADGVHLGQHDLPPEVARQLLGPEAMIGYSTHSLEQAKQAIHLPIDYLAIGPVFPTSTKTDTAPVVGLEGVRAVKAIARNLPVVAIGGISEDRFSEVLTAGASSIATISTAFRHPSHIADTLKRLIETASKQI